MTAKKQCVQNLGTGVRYVSQRHRLGHVPDPCPTLLLFVRNLFSCVVNMILACMYKLSYRDKAVALLLQVRYNAVQCVRSILSTIVHEYYRTAIQILVLGDGLYD